jgi:transposase
VPPLAPKRRSRRRKENEATCDARQRLHHVAGGDLTAIEGIAESTALVVLREVGTDLRRWPSEKHCGRWLGLAPTPKQSGGKRQSRATRPGVNRAAQALRLAAKHWQRRPSALGAFCRRIAARRGLAQAITATADKLARMISAMLKHGMAYVAQG